MPLKPKDEPKDRPDKLLNPNPPIAVIPSVDDQPVPVSETSTDATAEALIVSTDKTAEALVTAADKKKAEDDRREDKKAAILALATQRASHISLVVAILTIIVTGLPATLAVIYGRDNSIKLEKVHKLVNSNMEVQLELVFRTAKRLAEKTGEEADIEAAKLAEAALIQHRNAQEKIDENK